MEDVWFYSGKYGFMYTKCVHNEHFLLLTRIISALR